MTEIQKLEQEIRKLTEKLGELRKTTEQLAVKNYVFDTQVGKTSLLDLFGDKNQLYVIHNMGQGCRYCTTWADGINPFVSHLEDRFAVVLVSKDTPELQRRFANERGWRFRMASHGGGAYIQEQSVVPGEGNMPGLVVYERQGDQIFRKNATVFGPGDQFCSIWHILSLGGHSEKDWTPQYSYWKRPSLLDDGGENVR